MKELYEFVVNWMVENEIGCEESIRQCDRVQEELTDFLVRVLDCSNHHCLKTNNKDIPRPTKKGVVEEWTAKNVMKITKK